MVTPSPGDRHGHVRPVLVIKDLITDPSFELREAHSGEKCPPPKGTAGKNFLIPGRNMIKVENEQSQTCPEDPTVSYLRA